MAMKRKRKDNCRSSIGLPLSFFALGFLILELQIRRINAKYIGKKIIPGVEEIDEANQLFQATTTLKKGINLSSTFVSNDILFQNNTIQTQESGNTWKAGINNGELQAFSLCGVFSSGRNEFVEYEASSFALLRKKYGIKESQYLESFSEQKEFLEFQSNSKSRQNFFFSHDGRYMIKTQKASETQTLTEILPDLIQHMEKNPNSLINRFCGLYSVKTSACSRPIYFVVIENIMFTKLALRKKYDLKGSSVGRTASIKEASKSCPVLKDNDLKNAATKIKIGKKSKKKLLDILQRDVDFLNAMNLMDYSILLGIHSQPLKKGGKRSLLQRIMAPILYLRNKVLMLTPSKVHNTRFCSGADEIVFLGVIDILQRYNTRKYLETWLKSCIYVKEELSPVPPSLYSNRMVAFVDQFFK